MIPIILCLLLGPTDTAPPSHEAGGGPDRWSTGWHRYYQPIDIPEVEAFLSEARRLGKSWIGEPSLPVRKIRVRLSRPVAGHEHLRSRFRLTEIDSLKHGSFTIYLNARPGETAFYGQLAHEAFHLFEPRFRDVYIEGLYTFLQRKLLVALGLPWKPWKRHFDSGGDALFAKAFRLVDALSEAVGEDKVLRMIRYKTALEKNARSRDPINGKKNGTLYKFAIDLWLESLDPESRQKARAIVDENFAAIETERLKSHRDHAFDRPGGRE